MLRGCFREESVYIHVYMSFPFVSFQSKKKHQRCGDGMSSLISSLPVIYKQGRFWLLICFNTFQNFNRSLNKRRMSPAQTLTTECTAEKGLANSANKRPNTSQATEQTETIKSAGRRSLPKSQQRHRTLIKKRLTLYSTFESCQNSDSFSLSIKKRKVKSAFGPSGPSGRSLSRFP